MKDKPQQLFDMILCYTAASTACNVFMIQGKLCGAAHHSLVHVHDSLRKAWKGGNVASQGQLPPS